MPTRPPAAAPLRQRPPWRAAAARVGALAVGLAIAALPGEAAARRPARGTAAPAAAIERSLAREAEDDPCRAPLAAELASGVRQDDGLASACDEVRDRVGRRLALRERPVFGMVEGRQDDLAKIRLVLTGAAFCRRWLLREPGHASPTLGDALAARCHVRRLEAPLPVYVVAARGERLLATTIAADEDGRYEVRFADVDAALRAAHRPGLDGWSRIELGEGGWAGAVDLTVRTRALATQHGEAIARGRGVPALFALKHPEHPAAAEARLLAEEARALREGADYQAVIDGVLTPQRFLDRHAVSRFDRAVRARELSPSAPVTIEAGGDDEEPHEAVP
ncbi:MAG: hypothetical protein H6711_21445 [Myxococcales bacterium]|nr:hypothetical protein [Myxococcales bacterium]